MKTVLLFLKWALCCTILIVGFTGCENDDPTPITPTGENGVFILNQGSGKNNNAGVSFFDYKTNKSTYDLTNGALGATGQDMIAYGSKLYIAMFSSGNITVLDLKTKSITHRTELKAENNQPRQPRHLTSYGGKVYASTYDGNVIRLDTSSFQVEAVTPVGPNPEGIAAANGKLYVAISDVQGYTGVGTRVDVVDVSTFKKEKSLTVGLNPNMVLADQYGDVYLTYSGNFYDIPGGFQRIDTKTQTVTDLGMGVTDFTILGDLCYFYATTYNPDYTTKCTFGIYNIKTKAMTSNPVISDGTVIKTAYGIGVNPDTKDVYISDTDYQNPGTVSIFGSDGKKKNTIEVGVNACKFVFY